MKTLLTTLVLTLTLLLTACGSKSDTPLLTDSTIETTANAEVSVPATEGADSYHWKQLSGISVEISDADSQTLRFTAPSVTQEERLRFGLEAIFGDITQTAEVTVIVRPLEGGEDNGTTTPGGDDNSTGGGSDDNGTTGGGGDTVTLTSLTLTLAETSLNKDHNTTLTVEATYSDHMTKDVTDTVEWLIGQPDAVQIQQHTLAAKQDKPVILRAKLGNTTSNEVALDIYWEVNGYRLPPEPDKATNDATLLGIDVNGNGVRDDVERWIYDKYKDKHPIHIDIAMQAAKAYKLVLETPEMAKEIHAEVSAPMSCEAYYSRFAKYYNEPLLVDEDIINEYFMYEILYNTKERREKFEEYDRLLSGGTYVLPTDEERKALCDFNTNKYKE